MHPQKRKVMKQWYRYGVAGMLLFLLGVLGLRAGDVCTAHPADEVVPFVSCYTYNNIETEDEAPQGYSSSVFSCDFQEGLTLSYNFSSSFKSNAARLSCGCDNQGRARLCQAYGQGCLLCAASGAVDYYIFALRKIQV